MPSTFDFGKTISTAQISKCPPPCFFSSLARYPFPAAASNIVVPEIFLKIYFIHPVFKSVFLFITPLYNFLKNKITHKALSHV
jgi:hypothetical protein